MHTIVALPWFSSYEIIRSSLLINLLAGHFAATPKEYGVTFSTIKSRGSVQMEKIMVNILVIIKRMH